MLSITFGVIGAVCIELSKKIIPATDNNSLTNLDMGNESKKQVDNINNSNEKLLLSDVSESVCKHVFTAYDNTIDDYRCIWCGLPLKQTVR